ncbi:signal peptidase I, partial [candidate division KSB1 bacterium]|nr:signal peptidase I [candidate division KSB1 bacterium]
MNKRNTNLAATGKLNKSNSKPSDKRKKRKKNTARETIEAILVALIAAMILRAFVVQAFRIPTGSMKDTLLVGDFLLVNKFIYGVRTPDTIPFIEAKIPGPFRLPAFKKPENGDVVVFKYPEDKDLPEFPQHFIFHHTLQHAAYKLEKGMWIETVEGFVCPIIQSTYYCFRIPGGGRYIKASIKSGNKVYFDCPHGEKLKFTKYVESKNTGFHITNY